MILSYSLDIKLCSASHSFFNFISLLNISSRLKKIQQGYSMKNAPFFTKSDAVWDKFCTRISVATYAEKIINVEFKYET
jgi:hypothetical protein